MYKRKLAALDHPHPESFNVTDEAAYRNMVVWLEDQKIRHLKIEDRTGLRNIIVPEWVKAFDEYLMELNCPYSSANNQAVMDWLLGYAVRLEYGDNVEKYKNITAQSLQEMKTGAGSSSNPLDNMNFDDPDFKAGITSLSMLLQVPPHSDHLEQMKAICLVIRDKLSKEALEKLAKGENKGEHIPLEQTPLGFDAGDYVINDVAKILRLLHLKDLRDLQSVINTAIIEVQSKTANPKTDSRLGKVGFKG